MTGDAPYEKPMAEHCEQSREVPAGSTPSTQDDVEKQGSDTAKATMSTPSERMTTTGSDPIGTAESSCKVQTTKEVITLKARGHLKQNKWTFPWNLCKTWKGLEELIKQAFADNPVIMANVEEGKFELEGPEEAIIIPQVWETLVEPGWEITIKFAFPLGRHLDPDMPSAPIIEAQVATEDADLDNPAKYEAKVKYTVIGYERGPYGQGTNLLYQKSYDSPAILKISEKRPKRSPVLEEKVECTHPYQQRAKHSKLGSTDLLEIDICGPGVTIGTTKLTINSPLLLNALRTVIKYSSRAPSADLDNLQHGIFPHPYRDLYHHKDDLLAYRNEPNETKLRHTDEDNAECNRHIDVLVRYLYSQEKIHLKQTEDRLRKKVPTTTFASLWLVLKSGSDVYVREHRGLNAYVIETVSGGVVKRGPAKSYTVMVWNLIFNGTAISRASKIIEVPVFEGERELSSLPLFPVRFNPESQGQLSLEEQLVQRGKKYVELAKSPAFREYTGRGLNTGSKTYEAARVVIDCERDRIATNQPTLRLRSDEHDSDDEFHARLRRWNRVEREPESSAIGARARVPGCQCGRCETYNMENAKYLAVTFAAYDNINPRLADHLSDHQYFLCASHMYGFILKDHQLEVSNVVEPRINIHAIDRLVMRSEGSKSTIKAICEAYTQNDVHNKPFFADIIQGKGEGQILLLHGPPGTGKTLTAESVAEYTKRPLLSITSADLGHDPVELEQKLLTFFRNANDWDAIVLLDEADVYLEKRSTSDMQRNSIVSIFLRALDYFQGVLFLTTNRVGSFDEAFISRIHVQIGYDPLDDDARSEIWENNFRKLKDDFAAGGREIGYDWEAKEYVKKSKEVKDLAWNGREIRNGMSTLPYSNHPMMHADVDSLCPAFQTAVALAIYHSKGSVPCVKENHVRQVVNMSAAFKDYIVSTHDGMEDSQMAYRSGLRNDAFGRPGLHIKEGRDHGRKRSGV